MWMNEYEINDAADRWHDHPILGPATDTLACLMEWTNSHSDGWPYWQKPAKASAKLMELLMGDGTQFYREQLEGSINVKEYRQALRPIKAFRTRQGADFTIFDA